MKYTLLSFITLISSFVSAQNFAWIKNHPTPVAKFIVHSNNELFVATDEYCAKYDLTGAIQWQLNMPGTGVRAIAADQSGNLYLTGTFYGTMSIGNLSATSSPNNNDLYLAKIDVNGVAQWIRSSHGNSLAIGEAITIDQNGNPIFVGRFTDSLYIASYSLYGYSTNQIFIAKYSPSGNCLWLNYPKSDSYSGGGSSTVVKSDKMGNIYLAGHFLAKVQFDTITLLSHHALNQYDEDIFLSKLNSNGHFSWAQAVGGNQQEVFGTMDLDSLGNCYMTGYFESTPAYFGNLTLNAGPHFNFIAKFDPNGQGKWVHYGTLGAVTATGDGFYGNAPGFVTKYDSLFNVAFSKSVYGKAYNYSMTALSDALYITGADTGGVVLDTCHAYATNWNSFLAKLSYQAGTAGIQENGLGSAFLISPNPSNGRISLLFTSLSSHPCVLQVKNNMGQLVYSENLSHSFPQPLDLSFLSRGIYFIELLQDAKRYVKKVVLH